MQMLRKQQHQKSLNLWIVRHNNKRVSAMFLIWMNY